VILLTLFSYPVLEGIFAVQVGLAVSILLVASLALLRNGRELSAGFLLALTTVKPQMTILVMVFLLLWAASELRQRWQFAAGLVSGGFILFVSATLISTSWLREWLHVLLGYGRYSQPPLSIYLLGKQLGTGFSVVLLAGAVTLAWRVRHVSAKSPEFMLTISTLLAISVVVLLPGQAVYDHILLLPGFLLLLPTKGKPGPRTGVTRLVLVLAMASIVWPWVAAVAVVAASFFVAGLNDFWALLPIRTAASVPFALLACLGLILRNFRPVENRKGRLA
jgi:hypothetical protein